MKRIALLLVVGCLVAADAPKDDASKKELEMLQGTWEVVSTKKEQTSYAMITITGEKFVTKSPRNPQQGTLKLDPTQTPKAIDITFTEGPDKGKTLQGIYAVSEGIWKICCSEPGRSGPQRSRTRAARLTCLCSSRGQHSRAQKMKKKPPPDRRKFASEWDEIGYP